MPDPLVLVASACSFVSAVILINFLVRRPHLDRNVRMLLFFGMGAFPIGAAAAANIQGYEATQKRKFCGSCHVMIPQATDSANPKSLGLASRHARNKNFGDKNCYTCHADYGMFGTILTKLGGMGHVWYYYTEYQYMSLEEAKEKIHLRKPYPNANCMHCHSTELQGWYATADHRTSVQDIRAGRMSCASPGCHGYAHPNTKSDIALSAQLSMAREAGAPNIAEHEIDAGDAGDAGDGARASDTLDGGAP